MPSWKNVRPVFESARESDNFYFDNQGVVYSEFVPRGSTTINSASYCETLKDSRKAIKDRLPVKLTKGIHDNAPPRSANVTRRLPVFR